MKLKDLIECLEEYYDWNFCGKKRKSNKTYYVFLDKFDTKFWHYETLNDMERMYHEYWINYGNYRTTKEILSNIFSIRELTKEIK